MSAKITGEEFFFKKNGRQATVCCQILVFNRLGGVHLGMVGLRLLAWQADAVKEHAFAAERS